MQEALDAVAARALEQGEDAINVGLDEGARVLQRAVNVRLGGEVDDGVAAGHRGVDSAGVADVAVHKAVALLEAADVIEVAGVGKRVEVDNLVLGVRGQHVVHECAADEAGATRNENAFHRDNSTLRLAAGSFAALAAAARLVAAGALRFGRVA